jgi:hypothetical protein
VFATIVAGYISISQLGTSCRVILLSPVVFA